MPAESIRGVGKMFLLLAQGPYSVLELAAETGMHEATVRRWVRLLVKPYAVKGFNRPLRIAHWEKIGRTVVAFYILNTEGKPDAKRPPPAFDKPAALRRYRARKTLGPFAQLAYT